MIESEASSDRGYAPRMAGKLPALSVEERAKLSEVVTRLIGEHGSASKLEKVMAAAGHRVAQPTLSKAARGDDVGGYSFAKRVAAFLGQDVEEVLGIAAKRGPRWRALEGWADVEREARHLFPKVSELSWQRVGNLMGERPPSLDPVTIGIIATTWDDRAADVDRAREIADQADREMAAQDEAALRKIRKGRK